MVWGGGFVPRIPLTLDRGEWPASALVFLERIQGDDGEEGTCDSRVGVKNFEKRDLSPASKRIPI